MTNTKFRKRALLSSVAMLLVALVALGSATFAWFVANPTASASGLVLSAKASPGIAIASKTVIGLKADAESEVDAYKQTTILNATGESIAAATANTTAITLDPASPNLTLDSDSNDVSFGRIVAADAAAVDADTSAKFLTADTNQYRYNEKIYLKTSTTNTGDTATAKSVAVSITLNSATENTVKNGIKVVVTSSKNELVGVWKPSTGAVTDSWKGNTTDNAFTGDPLAKNAAVWKTGASSDYTASGDFKDLTTEIGLTPAMNNDGTTNNYLNVYIYLDGENAGVFSNNVPTLTQIVNGITVSVSTKTVAEM